MKWEYRVDLRNAGRNPRTAEDIEEIQHTLNDWGEEEWELVTTYATNTGQSVFVCKRPKHGKKRV
jgi:hypothetical protein